jgi:3-oxoacyl-[acyl-carrier-protein] synthase-3
MRTPQVHLAGLGTDLPPQASARSAVAEGRYDEVDLLDSGYTGALVAGNEAPAEMAVRAARVALAGAGLRSADLSLLVHAGVLAQGPDMWSPPGYILSALGGGRAQVIELRGGCNGILVALEVAAAQLLAYPEREAALLTAAENVAMTPFDRWRGGGPGFVVGDGASAAVLTRAPGVAELLAVQSVTLPELEGLHRGAEPLFTPGTGPRRAIDMSARAEQFGRQGGSTLTDAVELIVKTQADLVHSLVGEVGLRLDDMARVIYVNGSRYVLNQWVLSPLGLAAARTTWDYGRTLGHLGASDHLVSLDHLVQGGEVAAGDHVLLLGGAPGFCVAGAVLRISPGGAR